MQKQDRGTNRINIMMTQNRNFNLDWIRVIAMIGVITDHYICSFGDKMLELIGLQMGGGQRNTLYFAFGTFVRYQVAR